MGGGREVDHCTNQRSGKPLKKVESEGGEELCVGGEVDHWLIKGHISGPIRR